MTGNIRRSLFPRLVEAVLILLPLLLVSPSKAYGYADPGTGAYLYQVAYALFLGGAYYFRKFIKRFWGKRNSEDQK